ncbi:MAG: hypothetical protein ABL973_16830 [Micropepsaceae bacterium]
MRGMKRAAGMAILAGACVLGVSLAGDDVAYEQALNAQFYYKPPEPKPAEVSDVALGQALDAAYFARFIDFDRSYAPRARVTARQLAARLVRDARQFTHEEFVLRVAEIAALADNGHTAIGENAFRKNTPRLPLRTYLFSDGLYVLYAKPELSSLLGARIDSIEGVPLIEVFTRLRKFSGGIETHRQRQLIPVLESPALLMAAGIAKNPTSLSLTGIDASGAPFSARVEAEARDRSAWVSSTTRLVYPGSLASTGMISFLPVEPDAPAYMHSMKKLFWMEDLPRHGLYVGLGANSDGDEEPIAPFLAQVSERIGKQRPAYLVLDVRMNGGGDYTTTYAFARGLPLLLPTGNIYVLTSPWTFSAAITTVAAVKDAGGRRVQIVGEPVGDRLDFWAEGGAFELPNAFVRVNYATGRHIYDGPCTDHETCYWLNERYPVRVSSLSPDITVPFSFRAYREGHDPAMDEILKRELHE